MFHPPTVPVSKEAAFPAMFNVLILLPTIVVAAISVVVMVAAAMFPARMVLAAISLVVIVPAVISLAVVEFALIFAASMLYSSLLNAKNKASPVELTAVAIKILLLPTAVASVVVV